MWLESFHIPHQKVAESKSLYNFTMLQLSQGRPACFPGEMLLKNIIWNATAMFTVMGFFRVFTDILKAEFLAMVIRLQNGV